MQSTLFSRMHPLGLEHPYECSAIRLASVAPCFSQHLSLPIVSGASFPTRSMAFPFLLPGGDSTLRRALDEWFSSNDIRPRIVAELDDEALATDFAEAGVGVFVAPEVIEKEIRKRYKLHIAGRAEGLRQRFYAISLERKISHPAIIAICEVARKHIFT